MKRFAPVAAVITAAAGALLAKVFEEPTLQASGNFSIWLRDPSVHIQFSPLVLIFVGLLWLASYPAFALIGQLLRQRSPSFSTEVVGGFVRVGSVAYYVRDTGSEITAHGPVCPSCRGPVNNPTGYVGGWTCAACGNMFVIENPASLEEQAKGQMLGRGRQLAAQGKKPLIDVNRPFS